MRGRRRLADAARGRVPADLLLTNGRVFDALRGELIDADVAVFGDAIAGVGAYDGLQRLDVRGRVILPGFIDAGAMLEPTLLSLAQYARVASAHGTTAALFDFRALSAVLGLRGLAAVLEEARHAALDVFCAAPLWCAERWDSAATRFDALDATLLSLPGLAALGGYLDGRRLLESDGVLFDTVRQDVRLPAIAEAPGVSEREAAALAALGVTADRAWLTPDEALAKLRQGVWLLAPEGTLLSSVDDLRRLSRHSALDRCCLTTGPCSAAGLLEDGHLDEALRRAVRAGIAPATAVRMVTTQPAAFLGWRDRGAILPGYRADLTVVDDLRSFNVNLVVRGGRPVARQGESLLPPSLAPPLQGRDSVRPAILLPERLLIRGHAGECRIIGVTNERVGLALADTLPCHDGTLHADPDRDMLKVAVLERHAASGRTGLGFAHGFSLRGGAIACSFAGPGQNLIVAGVDDASMLLAVQQLTASGGGLAVVAGGRVKALLPLPYAGLLSVIPAAEVAGIKGQVDNTVWDLGCALADPFATLAALADTTGGGLRLTEQGLVDVEQRRLLPLQD